jgi:hypothetical protein
MTGFANKGSQKWLQIAVNRKPGLLLEALRESGALSQGTELRWTSPLENDANKSFQEYRDNEALRKAGIQVSGLNKPLKEFWPKRGPVWDAIGVTSEGVSLFVEAKAHIPEAASPSTKASPESLKLIKKSLEDARRWYAPKGTADWSCHFYQYANRLAYQYFLKRLNGIPSALVFLYFLNDADMHGPTSVEEWCGAAHLIHAVLGAPKDLKSYGVYHAFLDTKLLRDAV